MGEVPNNTFLRALAMRMKSGVAVREYVNYVCDELQVPQVAPTIQIEWNNRFTRIGGQAKVIYHGVGDNHIGFVGQIQLASKVFELATEKQQEQTIVHEVCHIAARFVNNELVTAQGNGGHGQLWKTLMQKVGFPPDVYSCVNTRSIQRKVGRTYAYCQCSTPHIITVTKATKMMRGHNYRCLKCRFLISLRTK